MCCRHITFLDQPQSQGEEAQIADYHCHACSYEDFEIVYRILNRIRISAAEPSTHAPMLDHFRNLDVQILVDLAVPPTEQQAAPGEGQSEIRQETINTLPEIYPGASGHTDMTSANQATKYIYHDLLQCYLSCDCVPL